MVKGYRYELELESERLGIFVGQNKILGYLESEDIISEDESITIKNSIYRDVEHMFKWLDSPMMVTHSKFYFSKKGDKRISKYISHLEERVKELGVKVVKTVKDLSEDKLIFEDKYQYAIKLEES